MNKTMERIARMIGFKENIETGEWELGEPSEEYIYRIIEAEDSWTGMVRYLVIEVCEGNELDISEAIDFTSFINEFYK